MKTTAGKVNKMDMHFVPFQSVGLFKLGDNADSYTDILQKYEMEKDEDGSIFYLLKDDEQYLEHMIEVRDGVIYTVFCYSSLLYKGVNLIGLTVEEFQSITNATYVGKPDEVDIFDDEPPKYIYSFDSIGANVWTHYGYIVDIIVAGLYSYEDD